MNSAASARKVSILAIASVILSMGLESIGNGLMFSYIPIRLSAGGFDPAWAGSILSGMSFGSLAGCLLTNRIVRRVSHARAYMVFTALIILTNMTLAMQVDPVLWLAARIGYGFAIVALFIISQSWLNDAVENRIRGRVMAIFYITYIMGLGTGSLVLTFLDIATNLAPLVSVFLATLSILPIGLTTLPLPAPPLPGTISFRRAWAVSPVGLASMLAVGGMSMLAGGFTPIHLSASGYSKDDVALLMFAMPIGTLLVQLPAGWISDRTDRRFVLAGCAILSAVSAVICGVFDGASLALLAAFFILWDGATESVYSIGNAHAGDKAKKEEMVELSATMLFAWSVSGFLVPGIATALTTRFGTIAYFPLAIAIALVFAAFVIWRMMTTQTVSHRRHGVTLPHGAAAPAQLEP
jgi:MFS family permease